MTAEQVTYVFRRVFYTGLLGSELLAGRRHHADTPTAAYGRNAVCYLSYGARGLRGHFRGRVE